MNPAPKDPANVLGRTYQPHWGQLLVHQANTRFVIGMAGVRGGKGECCNYEYYKRIYKRRAVDGYAVSTQGPIFTRAPRRRYWTIAPDYRLVDECIEKAFATIPQCDMEAVSKGVTAGWLKSERRLWLPGDIEVAFRTGDNPEMLAAVSLDGAYLSEAAQLKPGVWPAVRARLTDREGWLLAESTPEGHNWFYEELYRRGLKVDELYDPAYTSVNWPTWANPIIPRGEIEQARRDMPPHIFKRLYEGSPDAFVGQIFPTIVGEKFERLQYREVTAGIDWGHTEPGACVVIGERTAVVDGRADKAYDVIGEEYAPGRVSTGWIEVFKAMKRTYNIRRFYADPSSPMLIRECVEAGLPVEPADSRDKWSRTQRVQTLIHQKRLRIHTDCVKLLYEMSGYRAADSPSGLRDEAAPGQADHAIDCLLYVITSVTKGPVWRAL